MTEVIWNKDPEFDFVNEVDALETLVDLGDQLRASREQTRQIMRYMRAAVIAARNATDDGERVSPQAIINHSGLARQTVYDILGETSATAASTPSKEKL
ncbi:hypothetical protein [Sphaerisporangium sp. TRM90804]|uniref:hypothetical protein n=1 Tax=Sphaerisporangium sp. TRM90804 TaxID=3031113 RepID=UPI00244B883E|nr:hypothetical protein [Sphaerisporangium sp. TRM90804]MDH2424757.1 hypothetical protein [Sphaerisporangium sp. TRM90804]